MSETDSPKSPTEDESQQAADEVLGEGFDELVGDASDVLKAGAEQLSDEDALRLQLAEAQQAVLRAQAEAENVRKRMRRDMDDQLRYASVGLMRDLLPVLDNVRRAIDAAEKNGEASSLFEGVKMIATLLETTLVQHNCKQIKAVGQTFDPNLHEAILQQSSDEVDAGLVAMETTSGYQLYDRVVRPSQVIVSTGPATDKE